MSDKPNDQPKDQIKVEIIADSVNPDESRLTSFLVTHHRYIHAEALRHRMISVNSASSRAIPTTKLLAMARNNPVLPVRYGSNRPGMQAGDVLDEVAAEDCERTIRNMAWNVAESVKYLLDANNLHKQNSNRYLEPFLPHTVLMTATDWTNFFRLRAHPMAQPELQVVAYRMLDAYLKSEPAVLEWGQWHLPFGDRMNPEWDEWTRVKVATARCARLSYLTFDGEIDLAKDLALHDQLIASNHWSTTEHSACADEHIKAHQRSNFRGRWMQYRKTFENEHGRDGVNLHDILANKPEWITL